MDGTIIRQRLFHTENIHNSAISISIEFTLNKLLFLCIENTLYRHEESELNGVNMVISDSLSLLGANQMCLNWDQRTKSCFENIMTSFSSL